MAPQSLGADRSRAPADPPRLPAMLQLHVWGAAFGLPSIDAECLAAIAYLDRAAPPTDWCLVAGSDPSVGPAHHLPALFHDGVWTAGFRPIVDYLTANALARDLDRRLDARQRADGLAYAAHLSAHAAPLVDLSLYVSAANWTAATRPAYSALLPFPLTWTVPPLLRAEAIARAQHLGLAELDTDFDPSAGLHLSAGRDALPATVRRHLPVVTKKTVREEMTPEQAAAIRLHGLVGDCLSDVVVFMATHNEQRDGEPRRFFRETPVSSLDCLAYGHLALMVKPAVPRSFLRDWMQAEAPQLAVFVDSMAPHELPWSPPAPPSIIRTSLRVLDSLVRNAPGLGDHYAKEMRVRAEQGCRGLDHRALVLASGLVATGAVVGYGLYFYKTLQPFGPRLQVWRSARRGSMLGQFGEVGAILSDAMDAYAPAMPSPPATGSLSSGPGRLVEMDSEVD